MRKTALKWATVALVTVLGAALAGPALAASCHNGGSYEQWLAQFKKDAAAQGISQKVIAAATPSMTFDAAIIRRDHGQAVFQQTFLQFSDRMVGGGRIPNGLAKIKQHAALFARVEKQYGVPAPVLTAFWGLESDFGGNFGDYKILSAIATLAYDCRRPDFFRTQLFDALRIIERGDQTVEGMIGDWAGEFGGLQFTASDYLKNAVDFDGDGRRDLINSIPDTMASGANFLVSLGWQRDQPWLQEVHVPENLPWQEADLTIQHPRSQWVAWGVKPAYGSLPSDNLPASMILPMGRHGPAFLAYPNFKAFLGWNSAYVYSTTVAYYATRLAGAPAMSRTGAATVVALSSEQMMTLQRLLIKQGYEGVGDVDGKFGAGTRAAVKKAQIKLGLPADSYPTAELIERLSGGRGSGATR
jgi:lytic murein transglycosylase